MVTRTRSRATSLIALFAAVALLATACSDDSGDEATTETTAAPGDSTTTTVAAEGPPTESPAASLRSDLTALLEEQVYLTGHVVEQAVTADGDVGAQPVVEAADAAGDSATELSEVLGAAYGVAAGTDFLAAWNQHRQALVDYGTGGGSEPAVATAREGVLDSLEDMDDDADFSAVASGLEASDTELVTTIDELVGGVPDAAVDLRLAANEMPAVAVDLAGIVAEHSATEGEVDSEESALRAELTGLLQESALLTGLALVETVQADGDSSAPGPQGLLDAVDQNTDALADLLMDDEEATGDFAELWGGHVESFEAYTTALVAADADQIQTAEDALVTFRDDLGALLADAYPAFTKETVAEELVPHTDAILSFADALVGEHEQESPEEVTAAELLREAALAMRLAARTLAGGLTAPTADA